MTANCLYRLWIPLIILLAAAGLLAYGGLGIHYKVYEEKPSASGGDPFLFYEKITDPFMVSECTITGVARSQEGSFYFTYDRSAPPKACPT